MSVAQRARFIRRVQGFIYWLAIPGEPFDATKSSKTRQQNYRGYVTVRWGNIHSRINRGLDLNHDGIVDAEGMCDRDGASLTPADFRLAKQRAMEVLTFGLPSM